MHKKHKKHKNVKQVTFFFLDIFYANKKHENANKRISDFLPLRYFLSAFSLSFLFLFAYRYFCAFRQKKAWNYPNNLIYIILSVTYVSFLSSGLKSINTGSERERVAIGITWWAFSKKIWVWSGMSIPVSSVLWNARSSICLTAIVKMLSMSSCFFKHQESWSNNKNISKCY